MKARWYSLAARTHKRHSYNLLLVPWPNVVEPRQFLAARSENLSDRVAKRGYGLFSFSVGEGPSVDYVSSLLRSAESRIGPVDAVVFPELAMSHEELSKLAEDPVIGKRLLISGVGTSSSKSQCGSNEAVLESRGADARSSFRMVQRKHHRWKLDGSQITQYGISTNLLPNANWWEHIDLTDRSLGFITLTRWLTMSF
jgi:hypothetical protein